MSAKAGCNDRGRMFRGVDSARGLGGEQLTLATVGFERYAKTTRRAAFLDEMDRVVPWSALSVYCPARDLAGSTSSTL
jgi:hypothetical protein